MVDKKRAHKGKAGGRGGEGGGAVAKLKPKGGAPPPAKRARLPSEAQQRAARQRDQEEDDNSDVPISSDEGEEEGSDAPSSSGGGDDSFPEVSSEDEEAAQAEVDDDEGDEDDEVDAKEIRVEFEFFSPGEKDFLGLKALLTNYLDGELFDSSGLIDAIIKNEVGLVVKADEGDDPIAVLAALNTEEHRDAEFMKQIRAFLLAKTPVAHKAALTKAFESVGTGVLINDRLLNAPPQLSPPLVQFLMQDIQDCAEDEEVLDARARSYFDFKRYLLCTRVYVEQQNVAAVAVLNGGGGAAAGSSKKQQSAAPDGSQLVFVRPEDEFLHQHCAWCFTFPIAGRPVTKDGLLAYRLVMQVDADKVPAARADLDRVVGNMAGSGAAAATVTVADQGDEDEEEQEQEDEEAPQPSAAPKAAAKQRQPAKSKKAKKSGADGSGAGGSDIERMAAEAFAAAAAAGAGRGAGQKKKKHKVQAVRL